MQEKFNQNKVRDTLLQAYQFDANDLFITKYPTILK